MTLDFDITYSEPIYRQKDTLQKAQVQQNDKYVGDSTGFAPKRVITISGIAKQIGKEPFFNLF